jgi:hypothetical protein
MKQFHLSWSAVALFLTCSCGPAEKEGAHVHQVIGQDDRIPAPQHYRELVGSLRYGDFHVCTAFLSAPNTVSTAAHCAPQQDRLSQYAFVTPSGRTVSLRRRFRETSSRSVSFETVEPTSQFIDAAPLNVNAPIELISYSGAQHELLQSSSHTFEPTPQGILHELDTEPGSSGAPLIQNGRVVGVHEGAVKGRMKNYATRTISDQYPLSDDDIHLNLEWKCNSGCRWYQPDCHIWKELNCNTGLITVCGRNLSVPLISYSACQLAMGSLPATCTVGSLMTAGTSCYANIGIAAAVCSVSIEQIYEVGKACTKNL